MPRRRRVECDPLLSSDGHDCQAERGRVAEARAAAEVPKISVMMDVTNGEQYLDAALASLARQTFADFEIVLCAHGVTEETARIIHDWQVREPRLRVWWSNRLPLAQAHNVAARLARAPLLARMDADDIALPHRLERQYRMFVEHPELSFAGGGAEVIDSRGCRLTTIRNPTDHRSIRNALLRGSPIIHSTLMVRTEAFWAVGGYRRGLNLAEDFDLHSRLVEAHRAGNCPDPLVQYRLHSRSLSSSKALRLAIATLSTNVASLARRSGAKEPFVGGVPSLRIAERALGLTRDEVRQQLQAAAWRASFSRRLLTAPVPRRLKTGLRRTALALGLHPLYASIFRLIPYMGRFRRSRTPAQPHRH